MLIVLTSLVGAASLLFAFGGTNAGALGGRFVLTSSFDFELGANIRLIKAKTKTTTIRVAVPTEGKTAAMTEAFLLLAGAFSLVTACNFDFKAAVWLGVLLRFNVAAAVAFPGTARTGTLHLVRRCFCSQIKVSGIPMLSETSSLSSSPR